MFIRFTLFLILPLLSFAQKNFQKEELVAWCIVPYDATKRSPEERAKMVKSLGMNKIAYDWRKNHINEFEDEILAYKKHKIDFFAFWGFHPKMVDLIKKHKISPQFWVMLHNPGDIGNEQKKIEVVAKSLIPRLKIAAELGCKIGIYNHGGWQGKPATMAGVAKWLKDHGYSNVGIVFNFHHAHRYIDNFSEHFNLMKPHLICINLSGMKGPKDSSITSIGKGKHEKEMIQYIIDSGYSGPIGILDHKPSEDTKKVLLENISGLNNLLQQQKSNNSGYKENFNKKENSRAPLTPSLYPYWQNHINRDRIYDFYAKQAIKYNRDNKTPIIPPFPGLDNVKSNHWGNQNDKNSWTDGRVNKTDFGSMISGILRGNNIKVTKSFTIKLSKNVYTIFDAEKMKFIKAWRGHNVSWSAVRFGLIRGIYYPDGEQIKIINEISFKPNKFNGLFRYKDRVIFNVNNKYIEAIYKDNKIIIKEVEKPEAGPAQWPQKIITKGSLGKETPYALDILNLPFKNPWNSLFFLGGFDFVSKTRIAVCTLHGEVWLCDIQEPDFSKLSWKRFAAGLYQPLGLKVRNGLIHVTCRDQIVALHDFNSDDEADYYECKSNRFESSYSGHDYVTGLQIDNLGRYYIATGNQGVCRIDENKKSLKILGSGLRNPNGLAINKDASVILTSVQEGNWTPASAICDLTQGTYFGSKGPVNKTYTKPMLYLPRGIDNSSGGQVFIDSNRWGPVSGQWIHLSMGFATHFLVLRETHKEKSQAAAVVLPGEFKSGGHRGRFSPFDGQLYVAGAKGWANYATNDGSLQRVRYTGGKFHYPISYETRNNGIILNFSEPQTANILNKNLWFAQQWDYRYSAGYGSKEYSINSPSIPGHDKLEIHSVQSLNENKSIFIEIPQIQLTDQLHLYFNGEKKLELFATVHFLKEDFKDFKGYTKFTRKTKNKISVIDENKPEILVQACTPCHHKTQTIVGPSFVDIRKKYADNPSGIVKWAKNPQIKNPQLPPMPSFNHMSKESLMKIANFILNQ